MWTTISSYIWGDADEQIVPGCTVDDTQSDEDWILVDVHESKVLAGKENEVSKLKAQVQLEESWYVTPPPCFEASGLSPEVLEASPMEDLLIEHPSMSVYGPGVRRDSSSISSASRSSSTPRNEGEQVERREPRRTVQFQEQLDLIEKRRQTEPPLQSSIRSNRKNLKKQNMVHFQNNSRSKRNKKRNRMLGKHVGLHGKRGC
ncbi:tumor protein p53-inducible nuclear protein 2-like [Orbicella faveolata]|uniref:tumor protein p53-inducible nuclear protein 2-like n=1 Tax=Orbicella faveolata TaxID=48498 RepID=UPI0009E3334B|nr:tumor protein p53-inducible nuclear protein 2-like [Orbicella faveolata]